MRRLAGFSSISEARPAAVVLACLLLSLPTAAVPLASSQASPELAGIGILNMPGTDLVTSDLEGGDAPSVSSQGPLLHTKALGEVDLGFLYPAAGAPGKIIGPGLSLIQFDGPITAERRDAVERIAVIVSYFPDFAYLVWTETLLSVPEDLTGVVYASPVPPILKVSPKALAAWNWKGGEKGSIVEVFDYRGFSELVRADASSLVAVAQHPAVLWIDEPAGPDALLADNASKIVSARQATDGVYSNNGLSLWSWNSSALEGNSGSGLTVGLWENGYIDCQHADFKDRLLSVITEPQHYDACDWQRGLTEEEKNHGTHTSGAAGGNSTNSASPKYIGTAPSASLRFYRGTSDGFMASACKNLTQYGGSFLSVSSGVSGSEGQYTNRSLTADKCVRDADPDAPGNQTLRFFAAVGNLPTYTAPLAPATGKNVITVGNSGNNEGIYADDDVSSLSTRGPTLDGRIKPDLVAPGSAVDLPKSGSTNYLRVSGTSFSTPFAAGAAGLVWKYYKDAYNVTLTPAALKALLTVSADLLCVRYGKIIDILNNYPAACNILEADVGKLGIHVGGWGKLNASRATFSNSTSRLHIENENRTLNTSEGHEIRFKVDGGAPLRITVTWSDSPPALPATTALVNDLDAELVLDQTNTSKRWRPNNFKDISWDSAPVNSDSEIERKDNVEGFYLGNPESGNYTLRIRGYNVPEGPQPYALAIAGNITLLEKANVTFGENWDSYTGVEGDFCTANPGTTWVCVDTLGVNEAREMELIDVGDNMLWVFSEDSWLNPNTAPSMYHNVTTVETAYRASVVYKRTIEEEEQNGAGAFAVLKLRDASGTDILSIGFSNTGKTLDYTNGTTWTDSSWTVPITWHRYVVEVAPISMTYDLRVWNGNNLALAQDDLQLNSASTGKAKSVHVGAFTNGDDIAGYWDYVDVVKLVS